MHLLQRLSMFGGDGGRALRGVGSSPRAPPPTVKRHMLSRSESIKKRSAGAKRSKRARLRAGLAAALHELRLASRKHEARGLGAGASATVASAGASDIEGGGCSASGAAAPVHVASGAEAHATRGGVGGGGRRLSAASGAWSPLLLVAVLALACVVGIGRAPAVCCCTCAALLCRGASAWEDGGRRRSAEPCGREVQSQAQAGGSSGNSAARSR